MNGRALAEQLLQTRPNLKTIFISGYADETIAHHGVLKPEIILLQKPFSPMDLARKVREILDGP
jgi:two-component system cell cycle sensor histidine kinase/response regulator CckA